MNARQTGKTTRILIQTAVYITEHWDEEKLIVLSADTVEYAWVLAEKLKQFLGGYPQRTGNSMVFGKLRMVVTSHRYKETVIKTSRFDEFFSDHYDRRHIRPRHIFVKKEEKHEWHKNP